jgi:hypothetical protein
MWSEVRLYIREEMSVVYTDKSDEVVDGLRWRRLVAVIYFQLAIQPSIRVLPAFGRLIIDLE